MSAKFWCQYPKKVLFLKNGKPEKRYTEEVYGNKQGYIPTSSYRDIDFSKQGEFNDLGSFLAPWKFWVERHQKQEELYAQYKEGYVPMNHRIFECKVTDKGIVVEWGWTETDKSFLEEIGEKEPFVRSYRMVVSDIKKQLEDYNEIR